MVKKLTCSLEKGETIGDTTERVVLQVYSVTTTRALARVLSADSRVTGFTAQQKLRFEPDERGDRWHLVRWNRNDFSERLPFGTIRPNGHGNELAIGVSS